MRCAQMEAELILLRAALKDPLNQRFVLLSETCVPLYPAAVVWAQLMGEPRSRVNACADRGDPNDANNRMDYRCGPHSHQLHKFWTSTLDSLVYSF